MHGMFYGMPTQSTTKSVEIKPQLSPVQRILQRVEKRGTFLQMQDMIEILLISGFSFNQVKRLTIGEFRDTVGGIVLEASNTDPRF